MMVKLTNAHNKYLGMPIYLNSNMLISVYEEPTDGGSLKTIVYGAGETWVVTESLTEAIKIINGVKHDRS